MVVCKFFLQGNCRFGANCRNEHPAGQGGNQGGGGGGGGGFGSQNRFGALSNTGNNRFGGSNDNSKPYTLNPADIRLDLTRGQGRPQWVLSTYGAGRGTPASLFEGNEFSPEEIRARFYEMASKGQELQADQEAIQLWTKAEQDLDNAANHVEDISKFMDEAENKHPNRYDFLKSDGTKTRDELIKSSEAQSSNSSGFGATSAFGQSSNAPNPFAKPAAATFGQPSAPSAFGASSFGKPAQPSAFGQSNFGQSSFGASTSSFGQQNSTFGQPAAASTFGKPAFGGSSFGQSTFGQTAQPTNSSTFGQPAQQSNQSPFGQSTSTPAFGQSAFGQQSKPNPFAAPSASSGFGSSTSAFGQSTPAAPAFGQSAQSASGFGQSPQQTPAFGQPSQPASGFGQSSFGQPAQANAFGKPAFGQPASASGSSPFGQPAATTSGFGFGNSSGSSTFGQSIQQGTSPFAQQSEPKIAEVSMDAEAPANAGAQAQQPTNPFGTSQPSFPAQPAQQGPATPAQTSAPAQQNSQSEISKPLTSKPVKPLHYTETLPLIPPQSNLSKRLTSYRGQQVRYLGDDGNEIPCYNRPDGKGPERIWFPDAGATQEVAALGREDKIVDLQAPTNDYTEQVRAEFAHLFEEGKFKDGKMPLVAPMREWCSYDF